MTPREYAHGKVDTLAVAVGRMRRILDAAPGREPLSGADGAVLRREAEDILQFALDVLAAVRVSA